MNVDPWILTFSLVTVIVTVWMGFRSAKTSKTASDFFVAGRSVSVGWNASAISGEYLSAASFMGVAGMVMSSGYDALWYPVCYACGYLFLLLFIAGPLRRFGAYTIPDFAEGRYDSPIFRKIAVIFVLFIGFFYTMPQMKGAGTTLAYIFDKVDLRGTLPDFMLAHDKAGVALIGLPYWVGVVLVGAVITLNVALGGMKGITLVQAFQYWAKMFAISVPIFVLMSVYGHYGKQLEVNGKIPHATSNIQPSTNVGNAALNVGSSMLNVERSPQLLQKVAQFEFVPVSTNAPQKIYTLLDLISVTERKIRRLWDKPSVSMNFVNLPAQNVLETYESLSEQKVYFLKGTFIGYMTTLHLTNATLSAASEAIEENFAKNQIFLLPIGDSLVVVPRSKTNEIASILKSFDSEKVIYQPTPETPQSLEQIRVALNEPDFGMYFVDFSAAFKSSDELWEKLKWKVRDLVDLKNVQAKISNESFGELVSVYSILSQKRICFGKSLVNYEKTFSFDSSNFSTRSQATENLKNLLRTNGLFTFEVEKTNLVLMTLADYNVFRNAFLNVERSTLDVERSVVRKPLPEKAPKDETWISPFGPLTTKAALKSAVAAKPDLDFSKRSELSDPLPFVQKKPDLLRDLDQLTETFDRLKSPKGPVQYDTGPAGKPLWEIATVIKHWANLSDLLCETNLLLKTIVSQSPDRQSPQDLVISLEQELKKQGVTLIRADDKEWWAVSTANVKSYLKPVDTKPYALLYTYSLIIAIVCGTAGLPHILVRFYTNPDGMAAKRTTMWVMILIGVFYVFPPVFGVMGRNLLPELYAGSGAKGTDKIVLELPRILNERVPMLGSILSGITCAGAFAAFMSTFSGLLVSMTGALAHDVYGRILRPKSTAEQRMRAFKFCAVFIGGIAILLGSQVEQLEINFMVGQAFAIAAASYFPLLFMSVWWRGMTQRGAATGMLTGGLLALLGITLTSISDLALKKNWTGEIFQTLESFWIAHPAIRILCEQPAIWTVPLAITLMIVVSKMTQKQIPADVRMKMLVLHAPEKLGLKQEYIQEHQAGH